MTGRLSHFIAPNNGCWVGSAVDYTIWDYDLRAYITAIGYNPGAWNIFVELPMTPLEKRKLEVLLPYIGKFNGIALLTAEPMKGITEEAMPDSIILEFLAVVREYEETKGLRTVIRFGHEMNGNWYPWWVALGCWHGADNLRDAAGRPQPDPSL
jgi:hypothetical protein